MRKELIWSALFAVLISACGQTAPDSEEEKDEPGSSLPTNNTTVTQKEGATEYCHDVFCLIVTTIENGAKFAGRSVNNAPISIQVTIESSNMTATTPLPYVGSVTDSKTVDLFTLSQTMTNQAYSYSFKYQYVHGKLGSTHSATFVYRLPFATGSSFVVGQGYNGSFSHKDELANALDFTMPEGTPVHAARDGKVFNVVESFSEGGTDESFKPKANLVSIVHDDGSIAEYLHLKNHGAVVTAGQSVVAGDLLGYSGNTGYSTSPHLHFHVYIRPDISTWMTQPTVFKTSDASGIILSQSSSYQAID